MNQIILVSDPADTFSKFAKNITEQSTFKQVDAALDFTSVFIANFEQIRCYFVSEWNGIEMENSFVETLTHFISFYLETVCFN